MPPVTLYHAMSPIELNTTPLPNAQPFPLIEQKREEIDLFSLFETLLRGRKILCLITGAFVLAGLALALLMPQKWTSKAIISTAETPQLVELKRMLINLQVLDVGTSLDEQELKNLYLKKFDSRTLQETYLRSSPWIQQQLKKAKNDPERLARAIATVAERIKSESNDDPKHQDNAAYHSWSLSFTAPTAQDARDVLAGYSAYISRLVQKEVINNLQTAIELKAQFEQDKLNIDRRNLANSHNIAIQRLNYALEVANAAGIKQPVYSNGLGMKDDPDYAISLGANGLAQKLKIERSIEDITQMNDGIQNRLYHLEQLKKLNVKQVDFEPVKFQMEAALPLKSDGPGKSLVVVLCGLVGFIVASGVVLMRQAMQERASRELRVQE